MAAGWRKRLLPGPQGKLDNARNESPMTKLPNFFLLGAAKSGTTALYYWPSRRSEVHLSTPKESNFFEDECPRGTDFCWQTYFAEGYRGQAPGGATASPAGPKVFVKVATQGEDALSLRLPD